MAYDRIDAGGAFGRTRDPGYLSKSPTGLVPLLEVDGACIWESNSSLRHLASSHGHSLYPQDALARAQIDCWMDWQLAALADPMRRLFVGVVRTAPDKRDSAAIEIARRDAAKHWTVLDDQLTKRGYVASDALTIADICIGPLAHRWFKLSDGQPTLPRLAAWFARISQRPGFKEHVDHALS